MDAVEEAYGLRLDGTLSPFSSYINRVYGLQDEDGQQYVAKFYRPGRWSAEAIEEEQLLVLDCAADEIPVVSPLSNTGRESVSELLLEPRTETQDPEPDTEGPGEPREDGYGGVTEAESIPFVLYPKSGGRNFDAEGDEAWFRVGALVGRVHAAGQKRSAEHRMRCRPDVSTQQDIDELLSEAVVHPDLRSEFEDICKQTVERIAPLFANVGEQRLHGDCHRGNILERPDEGLVLIDFDDMMVGPPIQDLWLLLPDYADSVGRELTMMLDGYEQFLPFDRESLRLIEPLRFMRMVYYLAWQARQREDYWFRRDFPQWGTQAFWTREIEDLREQAGRIAQMT
jgi:Ser/Thr protein kinase RdoA (MazF antagonist)